MRKLISFILITLTGTIGGILFGIVHDQITFLISYEYYTKFKFIQFHIINPANQAGALIVGILACWWMGLITGLTAGLTGFIQKNEKEMIKASLESFIITVLAAVLTETTGFIYSHISLTDKNASYFQNWYIPEDLINFKDYITAGTMHNFVYFGGFAGILLGIIWQFYRCYCNKAGE